MKIIDLIDNITVYAAWEKIESSPSPSPSPSDDSKVTPSPSPSPSNDKPSTGDESNLVLWIGLILLCGSGVIATTIYIRKRRSEKAGFVIQVN